jgi:hypothetical protein
MTFLIEPEIGHLAAAAAAAFLLGYALCWALDRLVLRHLIEDRITGIALACALVFVLMMAAATLYLTKWSPFAFGPVIIPPIGYAISFIVGLAGVGAVRTILYGRDYEQNDDQAVFDVDLDDQSLYDDEVLAWDEKNRGRNYLHRHWAGHLPLPLAYWVNGALLSALIVAAAEFLIRRIEAGTGSLQYVAIAALAYLAIATIVWIWSSVGIWRSAYWHRRRGGAAGWGVAARALVAISLVATLFRAGDLGLQAAEFGTLASGRDSLGEIAEMKVSKDGRDLVVRGNLAAGAADRFEALLAGSPAVKNVVLTSRGGRMLEANRMAASIRERRLDTRVDDYCMSACTSLLLAGRERTAPEEARIGFHQPSFPGLNAYELREGIEKTRSEYLAAGVDERFVWRALATPAQSMWFPAPDELIEAKVLTGSDVFVTAGDGTKRRETAAEMRLRRNIEATAAQINASAPVRIDSLITLERASASGTTLTQYLRVGIDRVDIAGSRARLTRDLRRQTCSNVEMAVAVSEGGRFVYSYSNSRGKHLLDVTVSDCAG